MKILVERLDEEPRELHVRLDEEWINRELADVIHAEGPRGGEAQLVVHRAGEKVQVSGMVEAQFPVACSRCLEPAIIRVSDPYFMVFEQRGDAPSYPDEQEITEADAHWEPFDGPEIDLSPHLREHLLLAVPISPLCREDCPGLEWSGVHRAPPPEEPAVDPRWKALAKFRPKG